MRKGEREGGGAEVLRGVIRKKKREGERGAGAARADPE